MLNLDFDETLSEDSSGIYLSLRQNKDTILVVTSDKAIILSGPLFLKRVKLIFELRFSRTVIKDFI